MTPNDLVLVVEDDRDTQEALCDILAQYGYQSVGASNGKVALSRLRQMGASLPCVILLDLRMPVMDGWKFRAEQQNDPSISGIPVIVVTADLGAEKAVADTGAAAFVPKPIEVSALMQAVRRIC